jgi:hypothetical protein
MSRRKQQGKNTMKHEEGPLYDHLFQVQSKGTPGKKMRREKYYEPPVRWNN